MFYTSVIKRGNKILHRYIDDNGVRQMSKEDFAPTLYIASNIPSNWRTISGINCSPIQFENINEAREFIDQVKDVRPDVVHGTKDFDTCFIHEKYPEADLKIDLDKIKYFLIDIECESNNGFPDPLKALEPINCITIYDSIKKRMYTFSTVSEKFEKKVRGSLYIPCGSEKELITAFVNFWAKDYPDIVSGWNSDGFDIPYIINRISRVFGEDFAKKLSPWGVINSRAGLNSFGQDTVFYDILGVSLLDYLDLYQKFTHVNQESYKLGHIGMVEVGESKIEFDGNLNDLAKNDPETFMQYNQHDVTLLVKINEKLQLINLACTVAYLMRCNFSDTLGTVRPWTSLIAFRLREKNKLLDAYHRPMVDTTFEAAFVKDPIPGKYQAMITLDATAMYPSMIQGFNISPEAKVSFEDCPVELQKYYLRRQVENIVDENFSEVTALLKKYNLCMAGNGMIFRKDFVGELPLIVTDLLAIRKQKKTAKLENEQKKENTKDNISKEELLELEKLIRSLDIGQDAIKVANNSLFGAQGNKHFPLFSIDSAEAITFSAKAGILFVSKRISEYICKIIGRKEFKDYVIYIDTDSLAIDLGDIMDHFGLDQTNVDLISKIGDGKLQEVSKAACLEFAEMTNMMWPSLAFKREKICTAGVYVKKKRYFLYVHDSEGVRYAKPKLAITGLETKRSSTPQFVRDALEEALYIIIREDEEALQKYIKDFREVFMKQDIYTIAFPRSANEMEKYTNTQTIYGSKCPIAVRAALLHNHHVKANNLDKKYPMIKTGEKIKYIHLTLPNPIRENVIGFTDKIPSELNLTEYFDYDIMFDKSFVEPLRKICEAIGWSTEKTANLDNFFF